MRACKKFLEERIDDLKKVGLAPFCKDNPALAVCFCQILSCHAFCSSVLTFRFIFFPGRRPMVECRSE